MEFACAPSICIGSLQVLWLPHTVQKTWMWGDPECRRWMDDLSDFELGMVVGARQAVYLPSSDLLGLLKTRDYREWLEKGNICGKQQLPWPKCSESLWIVGARRQSINGQSALRWQKGNSNPMNHLADLQRQKKNTLGITILSAKNRKLRTVTETGSPKLDNKWLDTLPDPVSHNLCCGIWWDVSEFGVYMTAWIHAAFYQQFRLLLMVYWRVGYFIESLWAPYTKWALFRCRSLPLYYCETYTSLYDHSVPSSDGHFQQDNAPCRRTPIISNWFLEFTVLQWSPQSPDLSPTEHLCGMEEGAIVIMDVQSTNQQQLCDVAIMVTKDLKSWLQEWRQFWRQKEGTRQHGLFVYVLKMKNQCIFVLYVWIYSMLASDCGLKV